MREKKKGLLNDFHKSMMILFKYTGCHQMPSRSFFVRGYQFPLCARCTGVVLGYIIGVIGSFFIHPAFYWGFILLIPMGIDWIYQSVRKKESVNWRRFLVGLLGGIGIIILIANLFGIYS